MTETATEKDTTQLESTATSSTKNDTVSNVTDVLRAAMPSAVIEHMTDQPGDDVEVFRIETNFFNFQIERPIAIFAYYRKEDGLLQFSDRGLYSFCLPERNDVVLKRHRNFIRAYGYLFIGAETEDGSFVVNTPAIALDDPETDLTALLSHYVSLLAFCGEV